MIPCRRSYAELYERREERAEISGNHFDEVLALALAQEEWGQDVEGRPNDEEWRGRWAVVRDGAGVPVEVRGIGSGERWVRPQQ